MYNDYKKYIKYKNFIFFLKNKEYKNTILTGRI